MKKENFLLDKRLKKKKYYINRSMERAFFFLKIEYTYSVNLI